MEPRQRLLLEEVVVGDLEDEAKAVGLANGMPK